MPSYRAVAIADSTRERPYGHAIHKAWLGLPDVEMVALADPVEDARVERGAEIGAQTLYADYREMLDKEQPDLVSVCPHFFDLHGQWLLDSIEAGAKGIYVEKPLTASLAEADAVVEAADRRDVKIAVAHQNRYRPSIRHAVEMVRAGEIGDLRWIRAQGKCDVRGATHDLMVLGTHLLDAIRLFAGDPLWATGHMLQGDRDVTPDDVFDGPEGLGKMAGDSLIGYFAFDSGAVATFESFARKERPSGTSWFGFELWGSDGGISIRSAGRDLYRYPAQAPIPGDPSLAWEAIDAPVVTFVDGTPADPASWTTAGNQQAAADIVRCIENGGEPESSARQARATLEMVMAILEGQRTKARVTFPLETRENPLAVWQRETAGAPA